MASIESLLNPVPPGSPTRRRLVTAKNFFTNPTQPIPRPNTFPPENSGKRSRAPKDAPVFNPGSARGEIRYPPCEERNEFLDSQHALFEIHPAIDHISDFPRHIPYSSEKKAFLEKTGRESFEVYQYTFKIPNVDKTWTVMWDYNIGLVRTTHLFKCNEYSKTTPAKMLNANPGLRDVCHSITGGALAAQGYWMPYEAAKAVSSTFCWNIRFALTPLFGKDFPSICISPESPKFGKMIVDPEIIRKSTEMANCYRALELELKMQASQQQQQQQQQHYYRHQRQLEPSLARGNVGGPTVHTPSKGVVDTGRHEKGQSPTTNDPGNSWTPINQMSNERTKPAPRSSQKKKTTTSTMTKKLPSIKDMLNTEWSQSSQANPLKRRLNENNPENALPSSSSLSEASAGKSHTQVQGIMKGHSYDKSSEEDEDDDDDEEEEEDPEEDSEVDDDIDIDLDLTTDEGNFTSSDSDADLDIISNLSMLTSSDSEGEGKGADHRARRHGHHSKMTMQQRKDKSQQHGGANYTSSSSTTSPPPRRAHSPVLYKRTHHPRDREAAETLLTLSSRSGSSSVEERPPADSEKKTNRQDQPGQKVKEEQDRGVISAGTAAVSKEHTIKRVRRASF